MDDKKILPSVEGNQKVSEVSNTSEESAAEEPTPEETEAKSEPSESEEQKESDAPAEEAVVASEAEGEAKQSSSDENPTQIASDSTSPRNDESEKTESSTDEPAATDKPVSTDEPASAGDPSPAKPDQDDKKKNNPNAKWYVVHTYSGHENKVSHTLKQRIESEHLEEKILDVLVPTQDKIEIKGGKKVNIKEKIFPGYILVKMVLDDVSWLAVRTTQGVTSFVGMGNKPTPISEAEVATIVKFTQTEAPMYKQVFMSNDTVKIIDGPFADFIGKIDSVDQERGKVKVLVSIFGRETPVELDFLQVQKL